MLLERDCLISTDDRERAFEYYLICIRAYDNGASVARRAIFPFLKNQLDTSLFILYQIYFVTFAGYTYPTLKNYYSLYVNM